MKKNFKKLIMATFVLILMAMLIVPSLTLQAQANSNTQTPQTPRIRIDGEFVQIPTAEQQPVIVDGRTLVPLRAVMEALGFTVEWSAEEQTVLLTKPGRIIAVQIDNDNMFVNNDTVPLVVPAQIMNSRTMVPIRAISEATDLEVQWDATNRIVDILTSEDSKPEPIVRPIAPPIQTSVYGIELGLSPEELLKVLVERGIELNILPLDAQNWETIYANVENPVRDGRRYNIGGDFSFSFATEHITFNYTFEGLQESMSIRTALHKTSANVGVGSSRSEVLEAHGTAYLISPFDSGVIEYFDGENYLFFVFVGDTVLSWGIGQISIFEVHARRFS